MRFNGNKGSNEKEKRKPIVEKRDFPVKEINEKVRMPKGDDCGKGKEKEKN